MTRGQSRTIAGILFVFLTLTAGASRGWAQEVSTDFDPSTNFAAMRTYYWEKSDPVAGDDITNDRIVAAVNQWLMAKGWSEAPKGQADVAIAAHVATMPQQRLDTFYPSGWGGWGWGGWGGMATTEVTTYLKGTLIIDMFDAKTHKLIWRGTATDTISDNQEKNEHHIQKAIQKMFEKKFPPGVYDN